MITSSKFPHRWINLRSPFSLGNERRIETVEVLENNWLKIVQKHFTRSNEPWQDVFGSELMKVCQSEIGNAKLLDALGQQVADCLDRPLLILYSCIGSDFKGVGHRWLLVLPCGAVAYVWKEKERNTFRSCYFKGTVGIEPVGDRLRTAIRQQVQEFAIFDKTTGNYSYPGLSDYHSTSMDTERIFAKRFVSGGAWGFVAESPGSRWNLSAATIAFGRSSNDSWKKT